MKHRTFFFAMILITSPIHCMEQHLENSDIGLQNALQQAPLDMSRRKRCSACLAVTSVFAAPFITAYVILHESVYPALTVAAVTTTAFLSTNPLDDDGEN